MNAIVGVVGAASVDAAERLATGLLAGVRSRGPDGASAMVIAPAGSLGACWSLPGPDPGSGPPGCDATGRWTVALDGAPLNLRALREELTAREILAEDATPAQLVATLFAEQGFERGWGRVDGEVAVAAWDERDAVLWLARDRMGARALAWRRLPSGGLAFATDPAPLARLGDPPALDVAAIASGVDLGGVPGPASPWTGVHRLPPGNLLRYDAAGPVVRAWWTLGVHPAGAEGAHHRWATSVRFASDLAVRLRLPSQGPVAVALSGGVFSAAVAEMARERVPIFGLTVAFDETPPPQAAFPVHTLRLGADDLPGLLDEIGRSVAGPVFSPDVLVWWVLAREAWARDATVLLTGVGGAATHVVPVRRRAERLIRRLGALRRPGDPLDPDAVASHHACTVTLPERDLAALDAAGAGWQVGVVAPLADANLAALIAQIPLEHLRAGERGRALFLDAFGVGAGQTIAPAHRPLEVPVGAWLRGGARGLLDGLPGALERLLAPDHVAWLIDEHVRGASDHGRRLWALLLLARWRVLPG